MNKIASGLLLIVLLTFGSCKKGDSCTEKFIGNWYGPIHVASCVGSVSISIKPGTQSCEVQLPNLPNGSSCGNSPYQAIGSVVGDSLFVLSQPFGSDSVTAHGFVSGSHLTLQINVSNGSNVLITAAKQ